jgi:hypothetical protein
MAAVVLYVEQIIKHVDAAGRQAKGRKCRQRVTQGGWFQEFMAKEDWKQDKTVLHILLRARQL